MKRFITIQLTEDDLCSNFAVPVDGSKENEEVTLGSFCMPKNLLEEADLVIFSYSDGSGGEILYDKSGMYTGLGKDLMINIK